MSLQISVYTLEDAEGREATANFAIELNSTGGNIHQMPLASLAKIAERRKLRVIEHTYEWADSKLAAGYPDPFEDQDDPAPEDGDWVGDSATPSDDDLETP